MIALMIAPMKIIESLLLNCVSFTSTPIRREEASEPALAPIGEFNRNCQRRGRWMWKWSQLTMKRRETQRKHFCWSLQTLAAGLAITSFSFWQEPVGKTPSDAIPFRSSLHNTCYERRHSPFHSEDALQYIIRLYISWLWRLKTGFDRTRRPCDRPNLTSLSEEPIYIRYALYTSYIYTCGIHHTSSSLRHHTLKLQIPSFSKNLSFSVCYLWVELWSPKLFVHSYHCDLNS